jgi:hypothetical protein
LIVISNSACIHNLLSTWGLSKTWIPLTQHPHINSNSKKNESLVPPKDTLWMNLVTFHPFQHLNKLYFKTKKKFLYFLVSSLCSLWYVDFWILISFEAKSLIPGRNMVDFKFLGFFFLPVSLSLESHLGSYPGDALRPCHFPGCKVPSKYTRIFLWNIYFHVSSNFRHFRPHQENWKRAVDDCSERLPLQITSQKH